MNSTVAPSQHVELDRDGRTYGMPLLDLNTRARQESPPEVGRIFVEDLLALSAILRLSKTANRENVLAAYKHDLDLLARRRIEADGFMRSVLETAITKSGCTGDRKTKEWDLLQKLVEPLGIEPQIAFTAERAAMPAAELIEWLKQEFRTEIDRIARKVSTTLQYLADHNIVGLIDFTAADVCKFHYFRWDVSEKSAVSESNRKVEHGWVSYTRTVTTNTSLVRTRHTHHLVDAAIHIASDYKRQTPQRIKSLLSGAPQWLKKNLVIIDGTETLSEEITDVAGRITTKTSSVVRYDPAVALGRFALAGWNEDEANIAAANSANEWQDMKGVLMVLAAIVAVVVPIIICGAHNTKVNEKKAHDAYVTATTGGEVGQSHTANVGERLVLPLKFPLIYDGIQIGNGMHISLQIPDVDNPAGRNWLQFGNFKSLDNQPYGDIDLSSMRVPLIIHVQLATKDSITYTATEIKGIPEDLRHVPPHIAGQESN